MAKEISSIAFNIEGNLMGKILILIQITNLLLERKKSQMCMMARIDVYHAGYNE
jgi:hypothetical protein